MRKLLQDPLFSDFFLPYQIFLNPHLEKNESFEMQIRRGKIRVDHGNGLVIIRRGIDLDCQRLLIENEHFIVDLHLITRACRLMMDHGNGSITFNVLEFLHRIIEIEQELPTTNHLLLGSTYRPIALIQSRINAYSQALKYHHRTTETYQTYLPPHHVDLASIHSDNAGQSALSTDADE
jgi:hypothetical protein